MRSPEAWYNEARKRNEARTFMAVIVSFFRLSNNRILVQWYLKKWRCMVGRLRVVLDPLVLVQACDEISYARPQQHIG